MVIMVDARGHLTVCSQTEEVQVSHVMLLGVFD